MTGLAALLPPRRPAPLAAAAPARRDPDADLALAASAALAAGTVLGLAGAAAGALPLALAGGLLAAAALTVLLAAGTLPITATLALAAPLPALYASGTVRVAAVAPVAAIALVAWCIRRGADRAPLRAGQLPLRPLLALALSFLLATAFADHVLLGVRESLDFLVLLALLLAATDELARRPGARHVLVDTLVGAAGVCGALAVLEAVGVLPNAFPRWGTPYHRAALGFGQPNNLGLFLALVLPLAAHRLARSRGPGRALAGAALAATAVGLVATFSRTSWLSVLAAAAALVLIGEWRLFLRVGLAVLAAAVVVELGSGGMLSDTFARTIGDWVVEQRAALFLAAAHMFAAHPLVGLGPGGFADQVERYAAGLIDLWDLQATPHDAYIQMAAETGVIGLLAFLGFLFGVLRVAARRTRAAAPSERGLRLALFASTVVLAVQCIGIWPFSHGTGEAAALILALVCADGTP